MNIVWSKAEFGHSFEVEKLDPPVKRGAGDRHYRLYDHKTPVLGHQWYYTLADAQAGAEYLLNADYISRIVFLENRVRVLERQIIMLSTPA